MRREQASQIGALAPPHRAEKKGSVSTLPALKGTPHSSVDKRGDDDLNSRAVGTHSENERSDRRAPGGARSAICVQRLDDSLNSAIHTKYRSLLRSSSMHEPRGPPLEVVFFFLGQKEKRQREQLIRHSEKKKSSNRWVGRGELAGS